MKMFDEGNLQVHFTTMELVGDPGRTGWGIRHGMLYDTLCDVDTVQCGFSDPSAPADHAPKSAAEFHVRRRYSVLDIARLVTTSCFA